MKVLILFMVFPYSSSKLNAQANPTSLNGTTNDGIVVTSGGSSSSNSVNPNYTPPTPSQITPPTPPSPKSMSPQNMDGGTAGAPIDTYIFLLIAISTIYVGVRLSKNKMQLSI